MDRIKAELEQLQQSGMARRLQPLSGRSGCLVDVQGRRLINLSSNDYLGLAGDRDFLDEFYRQRTHRNSADRYGLGTASSRLLTGDIDIAHELEQLLGRLYEREAVLLFNSGYHANIGIIPALFGKDDLIVSDKLNHASIHDGLQICRAPFKRFRHADYDHLRALLEKHRNSCRRLLIVSESVFSMDGDCAELKTLVELKHRYNAMLYLDEAHAVGLYGENGLGLAERDGCIGEIDLLVGTFGKACGSIGAFLVCSDDIRDYLINRSRSLIFTTALPPVVLSWNHFVMNRISGMGDKRDHLAAVADQLRKGLQDQGLQTGGSTNIVPVIIGDARKAVEGAQMLQERGFYVLPVRPPTVPTGTSRFRLSLTADLQFEQLAQLPGYISSWLTPP
ncbi:MAG: 8-amino-7-oxononanoate synthase [Desulfofustis sp.]